MIVPFISITDFTYYRQVQRMLLIAEQFNQPSPDLIIRKLGVGVMMSHSTLNNLPSRFTKVFPAKEKIAQIFIDHSLAFNVLHYADYDNKDVFNNLHKAVQWGGALLHGLQLDMTWPNAKEILRIKESFPELKLIMQVGQKAFDMVDNDPQKLLSKLAEYEDSLAYVLLDKSMGKGKPMDVAFLLPFSELITLHQPDLGLVFGGGLGPTTLDIVKPLVQKFRNSSIDAQGKLRPSGSYLDPVNWDMSAEYLGKAFNMYRKFKKTH